MQELQKPQKPQELRELHLILVLDESHSMNSWTSMVSKGLDQLLQEQRTNPGELSISYITFDDTAHLRTSQMHVNNINELPYSTKGSTALRDAIVLSTEVMKSSYTCAEDTIIVVQTDGMDNLSKTSVSELRNKVHEAQEDGCTLVLVGANTPVLRVGRDYGFKTERIIEIPFDENKSMETVLSVISQVTTEFRQHLQCIQTN